MRTLGLGMMITGALIVWFALGKSAQSGVAGNPPTAGGSGFESGTAGGGSGSGGGGSW